MLGAELRRDEGPLRVPSSSEASIHVWEFCFVCEQSGLLLWGDVRVLHSSEQGKAGEAGLPEQESTGGRQDGLCGKPSSLRRKV